jgi:hypothetical protein
MSVPLLSFDALQRIVDPSPGRENERTGADTATRLSLFTVDIPTARPVAQSVEQPAGPPQTRFEAEQFAFLDKPEREVRHVVSRAPEGRFLVLQKWEGIVEEVSDDEFTAVLRDVTDPSREDERSTMLVEDVPFSDRHLLVPGAVFYWSIGYDDSSDGQRRRVSVIRLRRLPAWKPHEVAASVARARQLRDELGWK